MYGHAYMIYQIKWNVFLARGDDHSSRFFSPEHLSPTTLPSSLSLEFLMGVCKRYIHVFRVGPNMVFLAGCRIFFCFKWNCRILPNFKPNMLCISIFHFKSWIKVIHFNQPWIFFIWNPAFCLPDPKIQ